MKSLLPHAIIVCLVIGLSVAIDSYLSGNDTAQTVSTTSEGSSKSKASAFSPTEPATARARPVKAEPDPETIYWELEPQPFEPVKTNAGFSWTAEDGRQPEIIRKLSTNPEMASALEEENTFTSRRQLIYAPADFGEKAQKIYSGEATEITLPGFDGETFKVSIDHITPIDTLNVSGSFTGKIEGATESVVVAASDNDIWSIGIDIDGKHYQIQSRSQGEWIINDVDLHKANQHHGPCGISGDRTTDSVGSPTTDL